MEVQNLLIAKDPKAVEKLLKTYSTNEELREETIGQLIDPPLLQNGHRKDILNMDLDVDLKDNHSISREVLEKYLNFLGCSLVDTDINDED